MKIIARAHHLSGHPVAERAKRFVPGIGHIAGIVNPPRPTSTVTVPTKRCPNLPTTGCRARLRMKARGGPTGRHG